MKNKMENLKGRNFGRLRVIKYLGRVGKRKYPLWLCKCKCGNLTEVISNNLKQGHVKSCGCYKKEVARKSLYKHGHSKHPLYSTYLSMLSRCENKKNKAYSSYGGRGILVCKRWSGKYGFHNFLKDMGNKPTLTHSIDRRDNNSGYSPDNCYWATKKEQGVNKRNNRVIKIGGESKTLSQWCDIRGINHSIVLSRINNIGWSELDAITIPVSKPSIKHGIGGRVTRATIGGVTKPIYIWCEERGLNKHTIAERVRLGMSPENAILTPVRGKKR